MDDLPPVIVDESLRVRRDIIRHRKISLKSTKEADEAEREKRANSLREEKLKRDKQNFLDALRTSLGVLTYALEDSATSRQTFDNWLKTDPSFRAAVNAMHAVKKDFAENALLKLVEKGEIAPTIFVNRTLNKDRGYADLNTITGLGGESLSLNAIKNEIGMEALFAAFKFVLQDDDKVTAAIQKLRATQDLNVSYSISLQKPAEDTTQKQTEEEYAEVTTGE